MSMVTSSVARLLFSVEDKHQDPVCAKSSRTGYVTNYRGAAPSTSASKMQTQIALSTMETEYITLSQSMRDQIPIREILKEIRTIVFNKSPSISFHSHSKVHVESVGSTAHVISQWTECEDNEVCSHAQELTSRTKHIGIHY